ncbi:alcohol dehydrogenase catalytic domain-containing protein, partial [bacterium]
MKAVVLHRHGGPEVLEAVELPQPKIRADEVLVRVRAVALNHLDLWIRRGLPHLKLVFPHILGSDIAGEVAEVGDLVEGVALGQKVLLHPGLSCGRCER